MSAFVVSVGCMLRCVRTICARDEHGQIVKNFADILTTAPDAGALIGRRLFTMNVEAVQQRYPQTLDDPDTLPGEGRSALRLTTHFTPLKMPLGMMPLDFLIDGYKALSCLRYQCNEGDVDAHPMFQELSRVMAVISDHIVHNLPAYQKAAWG